MHLNLTRQKILLQYSGGKDSTACLVQLKLNGANFEAIHFVHEFSYDLPTSEAERICREFDVPLHTVDISDELKKIFLNDFRLRPCRFCKGVMDKITADYATAHGFKLICVGDTKDDSALINRLDAAEDLTLSKYFNAAVTLPADIFVYRPLIRMTSAEIFGFLEQNGIKLARVGDTGDKYFEYSREGCPLQFKDFGAAYSPQLMRDLKKYNLLCSEFARKKKIRAAIHLPSEFIVTIPRGFEDACRNYLLANGCALSPEKNFDEPLVVYRFDVKIYSELLDAAVMKIALMRFLERMNCKVVAQKISDRAFEFDAGEVHMFAFVEAANLKLYGHLTATRELPPDFMKNIFLEIFHTDKIVAEKISAEKNHA